jgi:acetyltransferase-like isoleucine patch superfamily enzyme
MYKRSLKVRISHRVYSLYKYLRRIIEVHFLKLRGMRVGENSFIGSIDVELPEQVEIGNNCHIEDKVRLRPGGPWKESFITIGDNTFIGHSTQINVGSKFNIGQNCMIAPLCIFSDAHHSFEDIHLPIKFQKCIYNSITIEDDVWIGSGVIILGGLTIGKGAVIAAGAVVNQNIPQFEIWGGIPVKKLKSRE